MTKEELEKYNNEIILLKNKAEVLIKNKQYKGLIPIGNRLLKIQKILKKVQKESR